MAVQRAWEILLSKYEAEVRDVTVSLPHPVCPRCESNGYVWLWAATGVLRWFCTFCKWRFGVEDHEALP